MGSRFLMIFLAFALASCASVPLRTMYNLWNFDPWSSDFREWRAGARLPVVGSKGLQPRITMTIGSWRDGDAQKKTETYVLLQSNDPKDLAPLASERRDGYSLSAYRIDPKDFERFEKLRMRIVAEKTLPGPQLHGELKIEAGACGDTAAIGEAPFLVSTYLLVDRKDGYNPLVVDFDLAAALKKVPASERKNAC